MDIIVKLFPANATLKLAAPIVASTALLAGSLLASQASAGDPDWGRELFEVWSCSGCHTLADAGSVSTIGPALDGNPNLSPDYIISRINNGGGAMPPFAGQLSDDEIAALADYIIQVAE